MSKLRYLDAVRAILDHLETTQVDAVERAADLVISAMTGGRKVYCWEIGHGIQGDFIGRAGGLAALQHFTMKITPEHDLEDVHKAVANTLQAGDVLLLGSVSGRNRLPVELAIACAQAGVKTIGFTSLDYTRRVESAHPTGKKLCDVADVVIDNGAPFGDSAVDLPGFDFKLLPVSGVAMAVAGWLIWERVIEKMTESGDPPTVFMSINRPGGQEYHEKALARFQERGY